MARWGGVREPVFRRGARLKARTSLARALSIAGHPGVLMPVAVALGAATDSTPPARAMAAVAAALLVALTVGAWAWWQVRSGRWSHADASQPHERKQLNLFVAALLLAAAALLALGADSRPAALGALLAAAVVGVAHALRHALKTSLHTAFAVYAVALVWPALPATPLLLGLAAGVAWSRRALQRHTPAEVLVGLLLGAAAGVALRWAAR